MKREEQCGNCGEMATIVRRNYRFDEMGLPVELLRIDVIRCPHCNNVDPIIPNMDDLIHTLALAVMCSPCKLDGEEIRFLRKYVGKSAEDFAKLIHVDPTHLSKIENGRLDVGDQTDKLIRFLTLNLSSGLQNKVARLLEILPDIEDDPCQGKPEIQIDPETMEYQYSAAEV
jgi:transcriptional regulator with XRE-family HTH domain